MEQLQRLRDLQVEIVILIYSNEVVKNKFYADHVCGVLQITIIIFSTFMTGIYVNFILPLSHFDSPDFFFHTV